MHVCLHTMQVVGANHCSFRIVHLSHRTYLHSSSKQMPCIANAKWPMRGLVSPLLLDKTMHELQIIGVPMQDDEVARDWLAHETISLSIL